MVVLAVIFWLSVFLVFHTYLFYPLILEILASGRKGNQMVYERDDELPFVSVIISAFNEEAVIAEKIESIFAGDYPHNSFEVLIGSDHSVDGTAGIIGNYLPRQSQVLGFYHQAGETKCGK